MGKEFILFLQSKGTAQKLNIHDTPQHLGVTEQRNRTIVEHLQALLHASGLPKSMERQRIMWSG